MPDSVFVDTGYILALVNEKDQHHAEAVTLSEAFDGQPIVVTDAVLLEIGNALSRMDREAAVQIIEDLRETPGVTVVNLTPELFESGFDLYRRHTDKHWGWSTASPSSSCIKWAWPPRLLSNSTSFRRDSSCRELDDTTPRAVGRIIQPMGLYPDRGGL